MNGTMDRMLETSARLLRLLSLLQSRRDWRGAELAGRLGVGLRTAPGPSAWAEVSRC